VVICVSIVLFLIKKLPDWQTANGIRDTPLVLGGIVVDIRAMQSQ